MSEPLEKFLLAFISLFVAIDPVGVVPLFLGQGGHVKEDLPKLVAGAQRPEVKVMLEKAIGEQPAVIEAIAAVISATR